ncbi:hypothetical protein [Methanobrevibacter sp.]
MTNFDFLKDFNNDLYQIGSKLEEDTISSPRAVTADATIFLETLVKSIYEKSKRKLESSMISFYKKIDGLYRAGEISYIYKNKLKEAYNLRNKIHSNADISQESRLAFDLHKRLYYISKKYFRDYCDENEAVNIPDYRKPKITEIRFDNCIICGSENSLSKSNMCRECNRKIDNINVLISIRNSFNDVKFTKDDVISFGLSEIETNSFLRDLIAGNVISVNADYFTINEEEFQKQFREVDQYIEIGLLLEKFYLDEITPSEIRATLEYWKGGINQKNYREFYRLVNLKLEKGFEENILKFENIKKAMKESSMDTLNVREWFSRKKELFLEGDMDDAFILFNELLIKQYFRLKKRNMDDTKIKNRLQIRQDIFEFWQCHFMSDDFFRLTDEIKKDLIIREVKRNKTLNDVFKSVGISKNEFDRLYVMSKTSGDEFHKSFDRHYTLKRQKSLIRHLKNNNLNKAIKISKITKNEFCRWYYAGEEECNDFYMKTTEILTDRYLSYRIRGWNKSEILRRMNISKEMVKSWSKHRDLDLIRYFEDENAKITSNLIKRGRIINALKEDKSREEAIRLAEMTPAEFLEIYNQSKREKSDFYKRFDEEYVKNRKRLFPKLLKDNDFYNAIRKCEITQMDFNGWYTKDQDLYISSNELSDFYHDTTLLLMDKYIKSRMSGKNKPDAARSVGLSNSVIDKWLRHVELDIYWDFKRRIDEMELNFIRKGFSQGKSKTEVSRDFDIPLKTIDEIIKLANGGFVEFRKIKNLYEYKVVPEALGRFLDEFKNRKFPRALKNSKLTEEELGYYCSLGRAGSDRFRWFYESYLELKITKYVNAVLAGKSTRIALKNSYLREAELRENEELITERIMNARFEIMADEIDRHRATGTRLSKVVGVSVEEVYEWYIKGKEGDSLFKEFSVVFELGVIIPRVMAFNHARSMGIPKNRLLKKLKKEIGAEEYAIWDRHDFVNRKEMNQISADGLGGIDEEKIRSILRNSDFISCCFKQDDPDLFEFIKSAVSAQRKFSTSPVHMPVRETDKSEVMGK